MTYRHDQELNLIIVSMTPEERDSEEWKRDPRIFIKETGRWLSAIYYEEDAANMKALQRRDALEREQATERRIRQREWWLRRKEVEYQRQQRECAAKGENPMFSYKSPCN
jgi:hypothetical protein